jgi:branched-chain amino acid transport system permease protein
MRRLASPRSGGMAALVAVVALLPLALTNNYFYDVAILVALNAIVCVGLNLLIGYAGQISLGHAGFFGLGAYGSAILTARFVRRSRRSRPRSPRRGCPPDRPADLRLRGHSAMATLGMGVIAAIVVATEDRLTGGPDGMPVRRCPRRSVVRAGDVVLGIVAAGGCGVALAQPDRVVGVRSRARLEVAEVVGIDSAR